MAKWARVIIFEASDEWIARTKRQSWFGKTEVRRISDGITATCIELDAEDLTLFQCEIDKVTNG